MGAGDGRQPPPPRPVPGPGWVPLLRPGLDVVFVGFNPSPVAAALGHYYANPRNRFWQLLADSGLTPVPLLPADDQRLLAFGCGLTDVVERPTPGSAELRADELRAGAAGVRARLAQAAPRFAAYTGKGVYAAVAGVAGAAYGPQAGAAVPGVRDFVLPSPSGRSGLAWTEKLRWYRALAEALGRAGGPATASGAGPGPGGPPRGAG